MPTETSYKPKYENSWALVIGINKYLKAPPLRYASNDAKAVATILRKRFDFPKSNITLLIDEKATKDTIVKSFHKYTKELVSPDDRILVFFAGHGHTVSGKRGEVGFLVPVDGKPDDLFTLIRWDELVENASLIKAKHMLFIMDACYGGLAVTRYLSPGSMRFLKDMLQRYTRQVLTAGKADEVVADAGGPRPKHSVFTGHLLNALDGKAKTKDGSLTANSVMSYVYDRVATDYQSQQTPHFGFTDGDGDFIFDISSLKDLSDESTIDKDILVEISPTAHIPPVDKTAMSVTDLIKDYLSDTKFRIKLDDLVADEIRKAIYQMGEDSFPIQPSCTTPEEFAERLKKYENITTDLMSIVVLLCKWGASEHRGILERIFARIGDINTTAVGSVVWLGLRWYPLHLLQYAGGIAALSNKNYENFASILTTKVGTIHSDDKNREVIISVVRGIDEVQSYDTFKALPGHQQHYAPRSEYLFKMLQPQLEDLLFLGRSYEMLYDKFEILYALLYAEITYNPDISIWGPPGRFAWKYRRGSNVFLDIVKEADSMKNNWILLKSGLFQSSYDRFKKISQEYEELLKGLPWH